MSQSGILNRGVYPPGTVVETIQGSNDGILEVPARSPDASNNIILNSTNGNLTFTNGVGNILNMTVSTSPIISYRLVTFDNTNPTIDVTTADEYISVDARLGQGTIRLPIAGVAVGEQFIIKDLYGVAQANNITVVANGGTIDQAASFVIAKQNESVRVILGSGIANNFEVF
jgi:hypothetical protein